MAKKTTRALQLSNQVFGRGILLAAEASDATAPKLKWVQIAKAGTFMGHPDFPEGIEFDQALFDAVVENLHAHPSFVAGADGVGITAVVPFDYEHASELDPTSGSIPQKGAPAPGWIYDLSVRANEEGNAELWALAKFSPNAQKQIADEEYKWTSVAIWRNAVDPVSGQDIGPQLTSVALTNHPFIQGMTPLAASRKRSGRVLADASVWGEAESPEEAIIGLRNIFQLQATATPQEIATALDLFGQYMQAGAVPIGVDAEYILRRLRELFALPALATWDEIASAAGGFISGLVSLPAEDAGGSATTNTETNDMPGPNLTAQLASILKCRDTDDALLLAAKTAAAAGDAIDKLISLLGSNDVASVLADAASLTTKVRENEGLLAALDGLVKSLAGGQQESVANENEGQAIEGEVAAAMASLKVTEDQRKLVEPLLRLAIHVVREGALATQEAEAVLAGMASKYGKDHADSLRPIILDSRRSAIGSKDKLAAFRKRFPLPDAQREMLTRPLFANATTQLGGAATGAPATSPVNATSAPMQRSDGLPTHIAAMPGRNPTEKAMAYLTAKLPGFKENPPSQQTFDAGEYLRGGAPQL